MSIGLILIILLVIFLLGGFLERLEATATATVTAELASSASS